MEKSLYKISKETSELIEQLVENYGEVSEQEEALLNQLKHELIGKTDGVVEWVKSQKGLIELAEKRINELKDFITTKENQLDRFDQYVNNCLDIMGAKKIEGGISSITKRKPSQIVDIYDERLIPIEYINVPEPKPTIMKSELAKDLKLGKEIQGCKLVESKTISISYK